ncbi:hypothetical protein [Mesorhizobium sp. M7A.F.Ca.US.008.03.1.1]|uniref:hypothetical protein n=1 Tax=Mesorhizobium sp. M7A.F.Ca.US.008.03.1.1 TaxID=2496742 RepID=UPI000FCA1C90|nr:hypothetical protein [Mesorhizobium sp. M7A.F.Ca.US.008.03.1.1]RUW61858.1 hypothetical protein EOA16_10510 [Mesorhizobium sp. M7A.F.Ca.US.008.03.1.1]
MQIVTFDATDFAATKAVLSGTLKDFEVANGATLTTLDDLLALVGRAGTIEKNPPATEFELRRRALAKRRLGFSNDDIANQIRLDEMIAPFILDPDRAKPGNLLLDVLQNDVLRKICSIVDLSSFDNHGFSPTNRYEALQLIGSAKSSTFLDPGEVQIDPDLFAGDEWWDTYDLWYGDLVDGPVSSFGRSPGVIPLGSVRVAVLPIGIKGLTPTILSHISFRQKMSDTEVASLPEKVRLPTALVVGVSLGASQFKLAENKHLSVPVSEWSKILKSRLDLADGKYFIFGVFYQTVGLNHD